MSAQAAAQPVPELGSAAVAADLVHFDIFEKASQMRSLFSWNEVLGEDSVEVDRGKKNIIFMAASAQNYHCANKIHFAQTNPIHRKQISFSANKINIFVFAHTLRGQTNTSLLHFKLFIRKTRS